MDSLSKSKLERLAKSRNGMQVSLFAPMIRMGTETRKNPIAFKNLVDEAERTLMEKGMRFSEAKGLLLPAQDMIADHGFWNRQEEGLAVFVSRRRFERFRLPLKFETKVHVGERFVIGPLLPLFVDERKYFVLSITQKDVTLYEGGAYGCHELPLKGMVKRLEDALWVDDYNESHIAFHSSGARMAAAGPGGGTGGRAAVQFHGKGNSVAKDVIKPRVERFLRIVDKELQPVLKHESAPMVIAGSEFVRAMFREISGYRFILEDGVEGNIQRFSLEELHREAWNLVAPGFLRKKESARKQYLSLVGTGRTSTDAARIADAARQGRVATLFVSRGLRTGGAAEEEVFNQAAAQTFLTDGSVYVIDPEEMPESARAAALFRY